MESSRVLKRKKDVLLKWKSVFLLFKFRYQTLEWSLGNENICRCLKLTNFNFCTRARTNRCEQRCTTRNFSAKRILELSSEAHKHARAGVAVEMMRTMEFLWWIYNTCKYLQTRQKLPSFRFFAPISNFFSASVAVTINYR